MSSWPHQAIIWTNVDQCWLLISPVLLHLPVCNFTENGQAIILHDEFENYTFKFTAISPRADVLTPLYVLKDKPLHTNIFVPTLPQIIVQSAE